MAVVAAGVGRQSPVDGQAVLVGGHPLKLQPGVGPAVVAGAAVAVSEDGVVADGEDTLSLPPSFLVAARLLVGVHVLQALHVPRHGEAGVAGRLGRDAAAQPDGFGLFHRHVGLKLLHLQSDLCGGEKDADEGRNDRNVLNSTS